jgi:leucyl-tRNA synthetase/very-short-patch-repair endonuclease
MEYNFTDIEKRAKESWEQEQVYKVNNDTSKPKCYVLDMFPYPSGAGLHVGHPLGYIASDIYARYKRLAGYNVLHPMGFDEFGLPAEQYAIETGQHPKVTTAKNTARYRQQLDNIGLSFDWSREVRTSDAKYYKWTQWIFLQLFHSWYDRKENKTKPIGELVAMFEQEGNINVVCPANDAHQFDNETWKSYSEKEQRDTLMQYRVAYLGYAQVWWCEALGTVLANDEVVNGVSERGGHPVERKNMRQWFLRITEYADRLLTSLDTLEWSEAMKEMQRNWIGKSNGAEVTFSLTPALSTGGEGEEPSRNVRSTSGAQNIAAQSNAKSVSSENDGKAPCGEGWGEVSVFTTRPDTIFGVDFIVLAPEHDLVDGITTPEQKQAIDEYKTYVKSRSERERMSEVKQVTGCFTGAYAIHPLTERQIPIWISEYVLAGYGTGAIMGVPSGDERDHAFAKYFSIPITNIFGDRYTGDEAYSVKTGVIENSDFLTGMNIADATEAAINTLVNKGAGKRKVNYKLRDAGFSRQRYWGEPFPIMYVDDIPYGIDEPPFKHTELNELPVELPFVESYKPGPEGQGPLANIKEWASPRPQVERELFDFFEKKSGEDDDAAIFSGGKRRNSGPKYSVHYIKHTENARINRKHATEAEETLWQNLRGNKLGEKFRRQHAIESYIVDFVCLRKAIIIEVDGGYHAEPLQQAYDDDRTKVLEALGFRVVRFTNEQVLQQTNDVLITIKKLLLSSTHFIPSQYPAEQHRNINTTPQQEAGLHSPNGRNTSLSTSGEGRGEASRETNTMPGYAGSSWYFLRYMDPHNEHEFAARAATDYWQQVDLYIGGTEHAVGHLLYSRMWTKALYDLGHIGFDEPFKKLLNQGMIQGSSRFVYRVVSSRGAVQKNQPPGNLIFISKNLVDILNDKDSPEHIDKVNIVHDALKSIEQALIIYSVDTYPLHVDVSFVNGIELNTELFRNKKTENPPTYFILDDGSIDSPFERSDTGKYICGAEIEKMSKSKYNVVNPDDIVAQYGADTFRMYEMFLGPIDVSKPWDTKGIEGVHRFLKKMWRLYADEQKGWIVINEKATEAELRVLHKTIKKISEDIERFSFNTSVSQFMICVNELGTLGCHKREILEPLAIVICPFAPHIAEELWHRLGNEGSVVNASFPKYEERYVAENSKKYPVAVNGKTRVEMEFALDAEQATIEQEVLADETIQKWLEGKSPKKFIYVKGKMINVVV